MGPVPVAEAGRRGPEPVGLPVACDHGAAGDRLDAALVAQVVGETEEILWLIEGLIGLVEIARALPCPACGGRRRDPVELSASQRGQLADGLLAHLVAAGYHCGGGPRGRAALFPDPLHEGTVARVGPVPAGDGSAFAPVLDAVERVTALGLGAQMSEALADGWIGALVPRSRCVCG
jgi:hypothetical protein